MHNYSAISCVILYNFSDKNAYVYIYIRVTRLTRLKRIGFTTIKSPTRRERFVSRSWGIDFCATLHAANYRGGRGRHENRRVRSLANASPHFRTRWGKSSRSTYHSAGSRDAPTGCRPWRPGHVPERIPCPWHKSVCRSCAATVASPHPPARIHRWPSATSGRQLLPTIASGLENGGRERESER